MFKASKVLFIISIIFSAITAFSLPMIENNNNLYNAQSITISESSRTLDVGYYTDIEAKILPETASTNVTWTSSNKYVATVECLFTTTISRAQVTAHNPGTTTITATTSNGKKASCVFTITAKVKSISLNYTSQSIAKGDSFTLVPTITPSNANNKSITWSSSNNNIATVSANGVVTGISGGTATITATTNNNLYASCSVTVSNNATTYTISYTLNGGTNNSSNPTSYTKLDTITLSQPTKTGYTFKGWTGSNSSTPQTYVSIPKGSSGNKNYTANWTPINYTITYNLDGGAVNGNPSTYNADQTITLNNPTKNNYTFIGWTGSNGNTPQLNLTIPFGSTGNRTYTANWTLTSYNIIYNLDGGNVSGSNPTSYTSNNSYTLKNPTKTGYTFKGWTGSNGSIPQTSVTIPSGSSGNRNYTANWTPISYSINYVLNGGDFGSYHPTNLTYDTTSTISNPTKNGYTFAGWQITGMDSITHTYGNSTTTNNSISNTKETNYKNLRSTNGAVTFTAKWNVVNYSITYNLDGGNCSNKSTYNIETVDFTLNNPTKTGYTFIGWTGSNGPTPQTSVTIVTGSFGDKSYYANYSINQYTISFNSNGGSNIESITQDYNSVVFKPNNPTYYGKSFYDWYTDETLQNKYTFDIMPAENIVLYAKWIDYDVELTYDNISCISVFDNCLSSSTYNALATDTNGDNINVSATLISGDFQEGKTINIRLYAEGLYGVYKIKTLSGIKVYGTPTITYDDTIYHYNLREQLSADSFNIIAKDSFEESLEIEIKILDKNYSAGDIVDISVSCYDCVGNQSTILISNIKLYDLPEITFNNKQEIKETDVISGELFGIEAIDSFGTVLDYSIDIISGVKYGGHQITVKVIASDEFNNTNELLINVKVYSLPIISNALNLNIKEEGEITKDTLGLIIKDSFNNDIVDYSIDVLNGTRQAGNIITVKVTAVDCVSNVSELLIENIKVYGLPTITYNETVDSILQTTDPNFNKYIVTFDLNYDNKIYQRQSVSKQTPLVYPENPTRSSYVFGGWFIDKSCSQRFNFIEEISSNITLYANWYSIGTDNKSLNMYKYTSKSSAYSYSLSYRDYGKRFYFIPLEDCQFTLYYKASWISLMYDTEEIELFGGDTSTYYSRYFNLKKGKVYSIFNNGSTSYTIYLYFDGLEKPVSKCTYKDNTNWIQNTFDIIAKDSFGNDLNVYSNLLSGDNSIGNYNSYELHANDIVGNTRTIILDNIKILSPNLITIDYDSSKTNSININSHGEEFNASAVNSYGDICDISIIASDGSNISVGKTCDIYLVATDKLGNITKSEVIKNIKIYGSPTIEYLHESNYIFETEDPNLLFIAKDSYNSELLFDIEYVSGEFSVGNTIIYKVITSDRLNNRTEKIFSLSVIDETMTYADLYINNNLVGYKLLQFNEEFLLPIYQGYEEYVWLYNDSIITNTSGVSIGSWNLNERYVVINASANVKQYSINYHVSEEIINPNSEFILISYFDYLELKSINKNGYEFLGWYLDDEFNQQITVLHNVSNNLDLYPKFSNEITYNIEYILNGGSNSELNLNTFSVLNNINFANASRNGYDFIGWYLDNEFTKPVTSTIGYFMDLKLYAYFKPVSIKMELSLEEGTMNLDNYPITITLDYCNEEMQNKAIIVNYNETFNLLSVEMPSNFAGWYFDKEYTDIVNSNYIIKGDCVFFAKWNDLNLPILTNDTHFKHWNSDGYIYSTETVTFSYLIPYNSTGKISFKGYTDTRTVTYSGGKTLTHKSSYKIYNSTKGTYITSTYSNGIRYFNADPLDKIDFILSTDCSMSASIEIIDVEIGCINLETDNQNKILYYNYNSYFYLPDAVRAGYTFVGWFDDNDVMYSYGIINITNDIRLTAKWLKNN